MPRSHSTALALAALLACSREPDPDPASFAELCGATAPVRLLELSADQTLAASQRIGDRLYHLIGAPSFSSPELACDPPDPHFSHTSVWSTGLCGESPSHLVDDVPGVFTAERWPDLALTCEVDRGVLSLDPEGKSPPNLLFPTPDCNVHFTDHGMVRIERGPDTDTLLLYPFPDDPRTQTAEPQTLLAPVKEYSDLVVWPDAVHVVDPDATLQRIDLIDRSVTPEQTQVLRFRFSADRRYLVWIDITSYMPDADPLLSVVVNLRDSVAGTTVTLGETDAALEPHALRWADRGLLVFSTAEQQRIYFLPDLGFVDLPPDFTVDLAGPLADDHWPIVSGRFAKRPWLDLLDLRTGTSTSLFARHGLSRGREDDDAALVLNVSDGCDQSRYDDEGPVWRVPFDGAPATKLAARASYFTASIDPGRLLTGVDLDDQRIGTLLLVDHGREARVDDHVFVAGLPLAPADDPTLLTYGVRDGDRTGVWTVRLPSP